MTSPSVASAPPPPGDSEADAIAAVVLACPAVAAVSGGPHGTAATYLPGRSVPGVRCDTDLVEVHVVLRYGSSVGDAVSQLRGALVRQLAGRRLDVVFEDVTDPVEAAAAESGSC